MKILHITPAYKPAVVYGGPIRSVAALCEALAVYHEILVFSTTANGRQNLVPGQRQINGVKIRFFRRITKDHTQLSPGLLWQVYKELRNNKDPDNTETLILHIHSWWNTVAMLSCLLARLFKIPVVLSPRGMIGAYTFNNKHHWYKNKLHKYLGIKILPHCHIHATTGKEAQDIIKIFQPRQITTIPNLISFPNIKYKYWHKEPSFKLLFLSRIDQKKGLELLFKALHYLNINWELSVAGYGNPKYIRTLKAMVSDYDYRHRVKWIGAQNDQEKFNILLGHDLLLLPSYSENFANIVAESLYAGTPVAISSQVGLADYVTRNRLGWIFELQETAIAKAINIAYRSYDTRIRIRAEAPAIIKQDFAPEKLIRQYLELYQQISEHA
jgi:glycosyltransferase involved in cell wall biosynthesis